MASFNVGDKVKCSAEYTYDGGTHLASFVRVNTYEIIQIGGNGLPDDRVVIGINGQVTAAVKMSELTNLTNTATPVPDTPTVPVEDTTSQAEESAMTSEGIEDAMASFLTAGNSDDILKYNMRLFGCPHQFTQYCDYRTYSVSGKTKDALIGRKFIDNIFLEAPVITIVPGKPLYLPAAKNRKGISHALLTASNNNMAELFAALDGENLNEKLRYYDFQQDYFKYMEYVNILCASAAAFLDLQNYKLPFSDLPLTRYKWQNYRWNNDGYKMAAANAVASIGNVATGMIDALKTFGKFALDTIDAIATGNNTSTVVNAFEEGEEDQSLLDSLESILTNANFVQFYIDPSASGFSESGDNQTAQSKIEGLIESGQEFIKEAAFLANSGGLDAAAFQGTLDNGLDELNSRLLSNSSGAIGGILSRIMSVSSNIIKGDNMIFPEIYQSSSYSKNYSVTIDLKSPYGNRLSYFLNILVPLFHLLALAIPRQTTANTYGSPFLIRAYYPGIFTCNLGIVQSIQIDKNPDGEAWSVDGFPTEIRVTLSIKDLYSDLSITPTGDIILFLANSSLVEYIATNCGVNLVTPQLNNRVKLISTVVDAAFSSFPGNVENAIFGGLENLIMSMSGV